MVSALSFKQMFLKSIFTSFTLQIMVMVIWNLKIHIYIYIPYHNLYKNTYIYHNTRLQIPESFSNLEFFDSFKLVHDFCLFLQTNIIHNFKSSKTICEKSLGSCLNIFIKTLVPSVHQQVIKYSMTFQRTLDTKGFKSLI